MKITQHKKVPSIDSMASKTTKVKAVSATLTTDSNVVEIWHSQDVKLSQNYQSAGCAYGIKLIVANNLSAIEAGIARLEKLVETPLVEKVQQQKELLNSLS